MEWVCSYAELEKDFFAQANSNLDHLIKATKTDPCKQANNSILQIIPRELNAIKVGAEFLAIAELENLCADVESAFVVTGEEKLELTPIKLQKLSKIIVELKEILAIFADSLSIDKAKKKTLLIEIKSLAVVDKHEAIEQAEMRLKTGLPGVVWKKDVLAKAMLGAELITEEEFEQLLDELEKAVAEEVNTQDRIEGSQNTEVAVKKSENVKATSEICENSDVEVASNAKELEKEEQKIVKLKEESKKENVVKDSNYVAAKQQVMAKYLTGSELITEEEFEALLVELDKLSYVKQQGATAEVKLETISKIIRGCDEFLQAKDSANLATELTDTVSRLRAYAYKLKLFAGTSTDKALIKLFKSLSRVVDQVSAELGKEVILEFKKEEVTIDGKLVAELLEPLTHIIRNSIDHGIELPKARLEQGKPKLGKIVLALKQTDAELVIVVSDDGKGIDLECIKQSAVALDLVSAEAAVSMQDKEIYDLILSPGVSGKEEISNISGRGVGMDIVNYKVKALQGSVGIDSALGQGTCITLKIPHKLDSSKVND